MKTMSLCGQKMNLRAIEPEDLEFLFEIENNEAIWEVSHTQVPFSKYVLKQYLENAHLDIFETKQLRLLIEEKNTKNRMGMVDLFDFNPQHRRAGIGILVHPKFQKKGVASIALEMIIRYAFSQLNLHQLYANIITNNKQSISLFKKNNFVMVGEKKDWILSNGAFKNEFLFQLINE
jgi:diamine N-acetyltransferase